MSTVRLEAIAKVLYEGGGLECSENMNNDKAILFKITEMSLFICTSIEHRLGEAPKTFKRKSFKP